MPKASSVSVTQPGLTTLTLIRRGASRAAARAKPSIPAFTKEIAPLRKGVRRFHPHTTLRRALFLSEFGFPANRNPLSFYTLASIPMLLSEAVLTFGEQQIKF